MMRIKEMEQCLDQATEALAQTEAALKAFKAAQPAIAMLAAYLGSDDWRKDLAADERGLLPGPEARGAERGRHLEPLGKQPRAAPTDAGTCHPRAKGHPRALNPLDNNIIIMQ